MRIFVIGDIHGAYRAFMQCLERSGFDYDRDHLISLGDVCDGWNETNLCIEELLKIKNLTYILGNHDLWALEWMESGFGETVWVKQGGQATINSYGKNIPESHIEFLRNARPYYLSGEKLFVHAGIDPKESLELQDLDIFLWDRNLARTTLDFYLKQLPGKLTQFEEVYIGHTVIPFTQPIQAGGVWMMDTGAGWTGVLSMMNISTREIFSSDPVPLLYPGVQGRRRG